MVQICKQNGRKYSGFSEIESESDIMSQLSLLIIEAILYLYHQNQDFVSSPFLLLNRQLIFFQESNIQILMLQAMFFTQNQTLNSHILQTAIIQMENIVRNFAFDLTRPRRYTYSHESLEELLLLHPDIHSSNFKLANPRAHNIDVLHLKQSRSDGCILYAHGLGSNKLEALPIAKYFLKQGYDVISFDFSGSGKSQGDITTYGIYEKEDVVTVLKHIEQNMHYDHLILWGRSMGAVASVLALEEEQSKVECLILDSPFSSFQKVAVQTAAKKSFIPQFMIAMVIQPLKKYFQQHMAVNPFNIDLQKVLKKMDTRLLLIYSEKDSVVNSNHAKQIIKNCKRNPIELIINQDHNMQRSKSTLTKTLKFIRDSARQAQRKAILSKSKNRGISVTSKQGKERESLRSNSKIKVTQANRASSSKVSVWEQSSFGKETERYMRTIASFHESIQYSKRSETQNNSPPRKKGKITSMFFQAKNNLGRLQANKENIKPCLNMLRKNRFR